MHAYQIIASALVPVIVACEVGFWILIVAGLTARYPLRRPRLGLALLAAAPLVDLILLVVTTVDLRGGADAEVAHALAAVYIGVSVAWGHRMIAWADTRFAQRFAGGPPAERPPRRGRAHAARQRQEWARHALAWAVGSGLLGLATLMVGDLERTEALTSTIALWSLVLALDFAISFSYTVWPRSEQATQ